MSVLSTGLRLGTVLVDTMSSPNDTDMLRYLVDRFRRRGYVTASADQLGTKS